MRDSLWVKNFIKSYEVHNFYRDFAWLTGVHPVFFNQMFFSLILSFNIELVRD
jgi:hypothetical protein